MWLRACRAKTRHFWLRSRVDQQFVEESELGLRLARLLPRTAAARTGCEIFGCKHANGATTSSATQANNSQRIRRRSSSNSQAHNHNGGSTHYHQHVVACDCSVRWREITIKTCESASSSSSSSAHVQRLSSLIVKASSVYGSTDKRPLVMGGTAIERSMLSMGSIAVYNVKPVVAKRALERKNYTLYAVHVQNAITGRSWVVHRRYSDFLLLREMIVDHFNQFQAVFPKLEEMVSELYFPRKHKIRSNTGQVVEHRCTAFLEYLVVLHRLLISQRYLEQKHISDVGVSILRGFLGSAIVKNPVHRSAYALPNPIPQCKLTPSDRAVVNQCGTLKTVLEDDQEYEDCAEEEEEEENGCCKEDDPVGVDSTEEEASMISDTDSHSTLSDFDEQLLDERRTAPSVRKATFFGRKTGSPLKKAAVRA